MGIVQNSDFDNVDTLNAFCVNGDITDMINDHCNNYRYIFGYSPELNNIGIGYFALVITIGVNRGSDYFFQISIGTNGKFATRAYNTNDKWLEWNVL